MCYSEHSFKTETNGPGKGASCNLGLVVADLVYRFYMPVGYASFGIVLATAADDASVVRSVISVPHPHFRW